MKVKINKRMTQWLLTTVLLLAAVFPSSVMAAAGDVVSIDIDGSGTPIELTVGKSTKQLKVWGTVEGSTVKKDLTYQVDWSSTEPTVIEVKNGFVTALKSGSAVIKAVYNNSAVSTITVNAKDTYKDLLLEYSNGGKYKLGSDTGLTVKATATVDQSGGLTKDVTNEAVWSSSNHGVITIDAGKITPVGEGKATITAKYSGLTASFEAEVKSPYSGLTLYHDQKAVKEVEMVVGDSPYQLQAKSVLSNDNNQTEDVTSGAVWKSSAPSVATVEDGAIKAVSLGKTTISAEYLGVKSQVDVYVRTPFEAIILTPEEDQSLFIGESLGLIAEVRSGANATQDVTGESEWTSSNQLAATVSKGVVSAKAVGNSTIKINTKGINSQLKINVIPTISSISADKDNLELYLGDKVDVPKVSGVKLDKSKSDISQDVIWTSQNESIAVIKNGRIEAKEAGTVTLSAKLPRPAGISNAASIRDATVEVELTIKKKVLTLLPSEDKLQLVIGEEVKLPSVISVWEDGEEGDISEQMEWSVTGANAVIKTTPTGKMIKGLTKGTATLKGIYSNKSISIPVVIEPKITRVMVEPDTVVLNLKKSKALKVTGYYANGKPVNLSGKIEWSSSDSKVASISSSSIKGVSEGTATLKGSYQGHDLSVKVSVVPKLVKLTADEKRLALAPGAVKSILLTAEYDNGKKADVTASAEWSSSKPAVAKVTDGKIEAVGKGSTTIKAKFDGKTITVHITVK